MTHKFVLVSLLAAACSAAELKPIRQVQPDYSVAGAAFLLDMAEVKMVVGGDGVPFSLTSSPELPDYIVRALAAWRYQSFGPPSSGVETVLSVPIRRALTPDMVPGLVWTWRMTSETAEAVKKGEALDESAAAALAAKLPPNEQPGLARTTLIVYYAKHPNPDTERERAALVHWLIEHFPQADILGSSYAELNPAGPSADSDAAKKAGTLWSAAVAQYPSDYVVTQHAAHFLRLSNPSLAMSFLEKFPRARLVIAAIGSVAGWQAAGVNSVDLENGHPASSAGLTADAAARILKSSNHEYVLSAVGAFTEAGPSLAKAGALPTGYQATCDTLVAHAKELYADAPLSCDTSTPDTAPHSFSIGGKVIEASVTRKVPPNYPLLAKQNGISGTVEFAALIGKDGHIHALELTKGVLALYEAARDAVLQWQYRPTLFRGEPVNVRTYITVNFSLGGRR